ncbi:hypothetical protein ACHWQZ_G018839 [Mnemiopsis leidyi]
MCWIEVTVTATCGIISHVHTEHGRSIEVTCEDGMKYNINLQDKEEESTLEVTGDKTGENFNFLKIEHHGNDMYITLQGTKFSVKDENSVEETAKLEELLTNPDFSSFSTAVQQVHDKLKLPGWEYPSVLFLYRIGMSLHHPLLSLQQEEEKVSLHHPLLSLQQEEETVSLHHPLLSLQGTEPLLSLQQGEETVSLQRRSARRNKKIDRSIFDYHGEKAKKECRYNGRKHQDVSRFIERECLGMCGQTCSSCWKIHFKTISQQQAEGVRTKKTPIFIVLKVETGACMPCIPPIDKIKPQCMISRNMKHVAQIYSDYN